MRALLSALGLSALGLSAFGIVTLLVGVGSAEAHDGRSRSTIILRSCIGCGSSVDWPSWTSPAWPPAIAPSWPPTTIIPPGTGSIVQPGAGTVFVAPPGSTVIITPPHGTASSPHGAFEPFSSQPQRQMPLFSDHEPWLRIDRGSALGGSQGTVRPFFR